MALAIVYGFGSFLFFKVASEILLSEGMNMMLCALAALAVFVCASWLSRAASVMLGHYTARARIGGEDVRGNVAKDLAIRAIGAIAIVFIWTIVLSIGFDQELYESLSNYWGWDAEELLKLLAITAAPLLIYVLLSYWVITSNAKRLR